MYLPTHPSHYYWRALPLKAKRETDVTSHPRTHDTWRALWPKSMTLMGLPTNPSHYYWRTLLLKLKSETDVTFHPPLHTTLDGPTLSNVHMMGTHDFWQALPPKPKLYTELSSPHEVSHQNLHKTMICQ